jgi:hypothetical protein
MTHDTIKANIEKMERARLECPEFDLYCAFIGNQDRALVHSIGLVDLMSFFDWYSFVTQHGLSAVYESLDFEFVRDQVAGQCRDERIRSQIRAMSQRRFNNLLKDPERMKLWGGYNHRPIYKNNFKVSEPILFNWAILNNIEIPDIPLGRFYRNRVTGFDEVRESYNNARSMVDSMIEAIPDSMPLYKVNHSYLIKTLQSRLGRVVSDQIADLTSVFDHGMGVARRIDNKKLTIQNCMGCGSMTGVSFRASDSEGNSIPVQSERIVDLRTHRHQQLGLLEA